MGSLPVGVHDIFDEMCPFRSVHRQSVQGADILVAPVHYRSSAIFFSVFLSFLVIHYAENNPFDQPVIWHPAYVAKEVQFPLHYFLHDVDTYAHSFHDLLVLDSRWRRKLLFSVRRCKRISDRIPIDNRSFPTEQIVGAQELLIFIIYPKCTAVA